MIWEGTQSMGSCENAEPTPYLTLHLTQLWASVPFRELLRVNDECLSGVQSVVAKLVLTKLHRGGIWLTSERSGHRKKQRKDKVVGQIRYCGRCPKKTKNRRVLREIRRKVLVGSWLPGQPGGEHLEAPQHSPPLANSTRLGFLGDNSMVQMSSKMRYFCLFFFLPSNLLFFTLTSVFHSLLFSGVILSPETWTYVHLCDSPLLAHRL